MLVAVVLLLFTMTHVRGGYAEEGAVRTSSTARCS